jgi:hypothetical protein
MTSLAVLAFALLSTVQSGELRPEWKELKFADGDPLRYVVVRNPPSEGPTSRPVVVRPAASGDTALAAAAVAVARAAGPAALVIVPTLPGWGELCAVAEFRTAARAGATLAWQRPTLVAEGASVSHALEALSMDSDAFAALMLIGSPELPKEQLASVGGAVGTPMALLRGRADPREPLLALLEQRLEQGADTQLDFASTCEHASIACNEGYLGRRLSAFLAAEERRSSAEFAVRNVLERFHGAAAKADGKEYFACLAPDAIFIGTDASERWTVPQFRAFCEPYFSKGKGWTYTASERDIYLAPDLRTAWFDECLDNESYGKVRGSGVLRLDGERWRITQYVLSIPVPNELAKDLVQRIRERR